MQNSNQSGRAVSRIILILISAIGLSFQTASALESADLADSSQASVNYYLAGIAQIDGVPYASLVDLQNNHHYLLSKNESVEGLVVASVQTDDASFGPSVVLEKDGASLFLRLGEGISPGTFTTPTPLSPSAQTNPNLSERANGSSVTDFHLKPPAGGKLPIIFQAVDAKKLNLNQHQQAILDQLRQNFLDAISGPGPSASSTPTQTAPLTQNANATTNAVSNNTSGDTALSNWISAQEQSDEIFKLEFGYQAFNLYEMTLSHEGVPKG